MKNVAPIHPINLAGLLSAVLTRLALWPEVKWGQNYYLVCNKSSGVYSRTKRYSGTKEALFLVSINFRVYGAINKTRAALLLH